jgi:hypothetical protein
VVLEDITASVLANGNPAACIPILNHGIIYNYHHHYYYYYYYYYALGSDSLHMEPV